MMLSALVLRIVQQCAIPALDSAGSLVRKMSGKRIACQGKKKNRFLKMLADRPLGVKTCSEASCSGRPDTDVVQDEAAAAAFEKSTNATKLFVRLIVYRKSSLTFPLTHPLETLLSKMCRGLRKPLVEQVF